MQKVIDLINEGQIKSVLDIGANKGMFSQFLMANFPHLNVFMIEANLFCDAHLKRTGIPYEIVCLSDTEKEVEFFVEDVNFTGTGASYYLEKTDAYSKRNFTRMMTKRMDDVVKTPYDLLKLDTQGSELDILKGGPNTVANAKFVLIETSLIEYNEKAPLKEEVFAYMQSIGFKPMEIVELHYMNDAVIQEDWIFTR